MIIIFGFFKFLLKYIFVSNSFIIYLLYKKYEYIGIRYNILVYLKSELKDEKKILFWLRCVKIIVLFIFYLY